MNKLSMEDANGITIKDLIIKALKNQENRYEDGSVNWCFVDADIHMDNDEMKLGFTNDQLFNELESFDVDEDFKNLTPEQKEMIRNVKISKKEDEDETRMS